MCSSLSVSYPPKRKERALLVCAHEFAPLNCGCRVWKTTVLSHRSARSKFYSCSCTRAKSWLSRVAAPSPQPNCETMRSRLMTPHTHATHSTHSLTHAVTHAVSASLAFSFPPFPRLGNGPYPNDSHSVHTKHQTRAERTSKRL